MKMSVETRAFPQWSGDVLVLPWIDQKFFSHSLIEKIPKHLLELVEKLLQKSEFKGECGEAQIFITHQKIPFDYLLVVGMGKSEKLDLEAFRKVAAISVKQAQARKAESVVSLLPLVASSKFPTLELAQALGEGSKLALYRFDRYKGQNKGPKNSGTASKTKGQLKTIDFAFHADTSFREGLKRAEWISDAVNFARDLVNIPSRDKPPKFLAAEAKKLRNLQTKVFNVPELKKMKMEALLGVGSGSSHPPVLVEMHYRPSGKAIKRVAIVGKGITFDSGGLSLKPPKAMETMKDDMAGAAAVLGLMSLLPSAKPKVEVFGYFAAAENMPDGAAQRPGDVVKAYNGKTIEVLNTDAEGRLVLADALSYVTKHREVDYIIDLATLTGAALVALGDLYSAALGTDEALIDLLIQAGKHCGEKIWPLPLEEAYFDEMKSDIADLKNIGGSWGGTINGGLFLKQFVDEKAKWVHLDIAGPAWASKPWAYSTAGGTGIMVRTLLRFIEQL